MRPEYLADLFTVITETVAETGMSRSDLISALRAEFDTQAEENPNEVVRAISAASSCC